MLGPVGQAGRLEQQDSWTLAAGCWGAAQARSKQSPGKILRDLPALQFLS